MRPGLTTATHSSGVPLPLPMRVSAGFFVTGLSGNTRIHPLPPRLRLRVSATRAASILRLVTQPGSSALRPYSPKASVEPRKALPRMLPRWALRYLTRLGISIGSPSRLRRRGAEHLALEDPHLDADRSVRRVGGGQSVIDVGPQRVERHPTVPVPLAPRDLATAQPAGAGDPDAVGAEPQRGRHRLLHGAAERDALLQLERDVLGDELGVELGVDDLLDVEVDLLAGPHLQLVLQLLDLRALATDDDARPRRVDGDPSAVGRALDVDACDAGMVELVLDVAPDLHVLVEQVRVVLGGEPARAPRELRHRPEAEADRMRLLAHRLFLLLGPGRARAAGGRRRGPAGPALGGRRRRDGGGGRGRDRSTDAPVARPGQAEPGAIGLVAHRDRQVAGAVLDEERTAHRARLHALHPRSAVADRPDDPQVVEVADLVIVLGVGHRRAQHLLDQAGGRPRRELERGQGVADRLAADLVEDQPRLAGGHAHEAGVGLRDHRLTTSRSAWRPPSRRCRGP